MAPKGRPLVLVLGGSGQTGSLVVKELDKHSDTVGVRLCSRRQKQVDRWNEEGRNAVHLDLDQPESFAVALSGVDRLFLLTGYTVDMVVHCKTLVDAAVKAGVLHIVHMGSFGNPDCTEAHFAWHQMVETYIEASGIAWTHLHPNYFLENLTGLTPLANGEFSMYIKENRVGWLALKDVAGIAAVALAQGPEKHGGKNYYISTESLNGTEVAEILSEVLGKKVKCQLKTPDDLQKVLESAGDAVEPKYAAAVVGCMRQIVDGRMAYLGTVRDDVPYVLGRPATTVREWAKENRSKLLEGCASE